MLPLKRFWATFNSYGNISSNIHRPLNGRYKDGEKVMGNEDILQNLLKITLLYLFLVFRERVLAKLIVTLHVAKIIKCFVMQYSNPLFLVTLKVLKKLKRYEPKYLKVSRP